MSIVAMKKLRLIAVRSQKEELLRALMLLGCVEITSPEELPPMEELRSLLPDEKGEAAKLRAEQTTVVNALRILDRYAPAKKGLLTPRPEVALDTLLDETAREKNRAVAAEILSLEDQVRRLSTEESRTRSRVEALTPWADMELPLSYGGTANCAVTFGTLPLAAEPDAVLDELGEAALSEVGRDLNVRYVVLTAFRDRNDEALAALRQLGFAPVNFGGATGTAAENLAAANETLRTLAEEKAALTARIADMGTNRLSLQTGADTLNTCIARAENGEKLLNTQSAFYFQGWLTAPDEQKLAETLSKFDCAWETEEPDREHPEEVPVKLKNNPVTSPFNMVTEMYSLPAYNGLDPNPFIMPFFALFFGIMFADMAYGILLLIGGLLFSKKAKPTGTMKHMAGLLIECGISTIIIGFLTGGFFGDVVAQIGNWFGQEWRLIPHLGTITLGSISIELPLDLLSGNNPLYMLVLAICLGAIHLLVGVGIGMYLKIRDGEWIDAIFNDFSWWVIIAGLGLTVLKKTTVVLWVGVGMMVLGVVLTNKGFGKVTGIFSAVYNGATGYLGDFLSYSRLMALMLAGSVIASVFNQLGSLGNKEGMTVVGTLLFIAVFLIGHALNFGLNLIGCFVHTLRLQFLEFFGKWYRDGGRRFRPLTVSTKYVSVKEEEQ